MMPGIFKGNATPGQPTPFQNFAITAAPMFSAMAAGYASGRGPYAYMDQGLAAMEKRQKDKRDAEAAAAASAAFKALMRPGGNGVARGGYSPSGTWSPAPPPPSPVDVATQGMDVARSGGLSFGDRQKAESGMIGGGQEKLGFGSAVMSPQEMLIAGAEARGLNPIDVATAISYETGGRFDPMIAGPTTQWGTHRGLIQFGEPQAKQHGVDFSNPDAAWRSQLDPTSGAVWKYLDGAGVRPGMGLPEVYSAINAGSVGRMNASDANNGGAPGTVADKVAGMGPHREKAAQFLGGTWTPNDNVTMSAKDGGGFVPGYAGGPVDPMADPYVQQLMTVMSMPGLSPEQQAVAQTMLQSRIQLITTPQPGAEEEQERARRARDAEMLGLQPGTPQFNQYVVTGQMPAPADPLAEIKLKQAELDYQQDLLAPPPNPEAPTTKNVKLADGSEVMVQWNPKTQVWDASPIPEGGTTGSGQKLTESQSKLTLFQTLQTETAPVLSELEQQFDPANLKDPSLASIPIAGNYFTSSEYQMYSAAAAAWAEGALRISTGAAATQPEIDRIVKVYFAQPGDTPQTVAFKAQMREMYDRAVNNALGKPNGGGQLMLPDDFASGVMGDAAGAPAPGSVLKFDANGNIIP